MVFSINEAVKMKYNGTVAAIRAISLSPILPIPTTNPNPEGWIEQPGIEQYGRHA